MLEGKELLEKAKLLSKKSEDEIARGCGYVGPSGRILRKSFYRALIEAKGYKIGNGRQGKNGNRASRGRQTEFKTKVHGNGNLLIGHACTHNSCSQVSSKLFSVISMSPSSSAH